VAWGEVPHGALPSYPPGFASIALKADIPVSSGARRSNGLRAPSSSSERLLTHNGGAQMSNQKRAQGTDRAVPEPVTESPDQQRPGTGLAELEALAELKKQDEAIESQPEELKQPDPQTPVLVDGYKADKSSLLQFDGYGQAKEPRYKVVLSGKTLQLLAHVIEGDATVAVRALISFGDRPARPYEILSSVAVNQARGAEELTRITGKPWTPQQAGVVGRWLTQAASTEAPSIRIVSKARWSGDWLLVPGRNTLGPRTFYGETDGDERAARRAWHEVIDAGEEHPRFAIYVGAAVIAPFIGRLGLDVRGFIANVYGNQNSGKTESLRTACAAFGVPREDHLLRDWRGTAGALLGEVRDAGILPVFMDDTSKIAADRPGDAERVIEEMAYAVSGGRDKSRLQTDGSLRAAATFETVVLSTSEAPILAAGKTGMISRVVEIEAPLVDAGNASNSATLQRRLEDVTAQHCGWPLHWVLTSGIGIDDPRQFLRRSEYTYVGSGDPLERAARNIAACALGWNILALVADYPNRPLGENLGRAVFDEFREHAAAVGVSQEERLWAELSGFVLGNARRIEGIGLRAGEDGDVIGRWWKESGNVALLPTELKKLAKDMGVGDPTTALSGLAKDGRLRRDSQGKLTDTVRIAGKKVRAYVFEGLLPDVSEDDSVPP
jgi:hypothetical protein